MLGPASRCARFFGALLRQAVRSASRTVLFFAVRSRTFVAPYRPQPPLTGWNPSGSI